MKIFLAGGTGFLGSYLGRAFMNQGHQVTVLARQPSSAARCMPGIRVINGDPLTKGDWQDELATHDAVINLTGTSIFQRWPKAVKAAIRESRVLSTAHIVDAILQSPGKGTVLFNASGVGYYGSCGDTAVSESSEPGNTFLAQVASAWEKTALRAAEAGIRVVLCRFGIVLGKEGGAFPRLVRMSRLHLGARWGTGEQWFSWVHEDDVARSFMFLLEHDDIRGPVNFTAPEPVRNREMADVLDQVLRTRPLLSVVPAWMLRTVLGEFSHVFLAGQRALPDVLTRHGFAFRFPDFKDAAVDLLNDPRDCAV